MVLDIEAGKLTQLTAGDYEDYSPAWSPDGSRIAFVSNRTAEPDYSSNTDIWLIDPDTPYDKQEPVRVTTNTGSDRSPIWHPDGKRIAYITAYTDRTDVPDSYLQSKIAIIQPGEDEPVLGSASWDGSIRLWDSGGTHRVLFSHTDPTP